MKSTAILSISAVIGLLITTATAAPIAGSRLVRRDDSCPGTLRAPSGNAYFAFNSNLNNQVAQEACASCYGGTLANVGIADMEFLTANLQQTSWIKGWNGDDYSGSCMTLQPSGGATPTVGVDSACASEIWPLCAANADMANGGQPIEAQSVTTLSALAVPFVRRDMTPQEVIGTVENVEGTVSTIIDGENAPAPDPSTPPAPEVTCSKRVEVAETVEGDVQTQLASSDPTVLSCTACLNATEAEDFTSNAPTDGRGPPAGVPGPPAKVPGPPAGVPGPPAKDPTPVNPDPEIPSPVVPAPEIPSPVMPAPEIPSPVVPAPEIPSPVMPAPEIPSPVVPAPEIPSPVVPAPEIPSPVVPAPETPSPVVPAPETPSPVVPAPEVPVPGTPAPPAEVPIPDIPVPIPTPVPEVPAPVVPVVPEPAVPAPEVPAPEVPAQQAPGPDAPSGEASVSALAEERLMAEKAKVRDAFEEENQACSTQLAMGEQDPLVNEYMIERMIETSSCSEARQEALLVDAQEHSASIAAAQAALIAQAAPAVAAQ
ncbi:hypothetical protein EC968_003244 [Mortierella alpina]|nr:hypothetical protein EC968_003244 [Mortierella alpina]